MQKIKFEEGIERIMERDARYNPDAYLFVREGLDFTVKLHKKTGQVATRHVTGQELLEGLRRYALQQFGPMTKTVLSYWGVKRCEDFGEIVFNMVDGGILGKQERDSRDDFKGGYDFDEVFVKPYQPSQPRHVRHVDSPQRSGAERLGDGQRSADATTELSGGAN